MPNRYFGEAGGPVAEIREVGRGLDLVQFDRRDHLLRLGQVVDRPGAAPLPIREQEAVRDRDVAVGGGVADVGVLATAVLIPGHQVGGVDARVCAEVLVEAIEHDLRVGVVSGHQRDDLHPVALTLGDHHAARVTLRVDDEFSGAAARRHEPRLPLVVEGGGRCVSS